MKIIPGKAILASAGSGKTYQLAHRYIQLLVDGEQVRDIWALTFSRKAAGEILESVLKYLYESVLDPKKLEATRAQIKRPALTRARLLECLRIFTDQMSRCAIGTLDSFTLGIVRAFPAELGISPDFQVADGKSGLGLSLKRRVLEVIFNPEVLGPEAQTEFLGAFKLASFGHDEKRMESNFLSMVETWHDVWRHAHDKYAWGSFAAVWGDPRGPGAPMPDDERRRNGALLKQLVLADAGLAPVAKSLLEVVEFLAAFDARSAWDGTVFTNKVPKQVIEKARQFGMREPLEVELRNRAYRLSPQASGLLADLVENALVIEFRRCVEAAGGIARVMEIYEREYLREGNRAGILTFSDAQYLLGRKPFSGNEGAALYVGYRLDCRLRHLLLDEFQDTSNIQWEGLRGLAEEILTDTSDERSLLVVGDIKQAIYGWRGGNVEIIRELIRTFGAGHGRLLSETLSTSERSCPQVVETVNRTFGHLPEGSVHAGAIRRWEEPGVWMDHISSPRVAGGTGYSTVLMPKVENGRPSHDDFLRLTAALVRELDPGRREIDVAILVRGNDFGRELLDHLSRECPGIPIVLEGAASLKGSRCVELLRSLVVFAHHPGDGIAWQHVMASSLFGERGRVRPDRDALAQTLLASIQKLGFAAFMEEWARRLAKAEPGLTSYESRQLHLLVRMAGEFDGLGIADGDAFSDWLDTWQYRDGGGRGAARIMTIHQSKGLTFDAVILPELDTALDGNPKHGSALAGEGPDGKWMITMPRQAVCKTDPVVSSAADVLAERMAFESLCGLYVAMTRPRFGLYMLVGAEAANERRTQAGDLLRQQLGRESSAEVRVGMEPCIRLWELGNEGWFRDKQFSKAPAIGAESEMFELPGLFPRDFAGRASPFSGPEHEEPSRLSVEAVRASSLFTKDATGFRAAGSVAHELFAAVRWLEDADVAEIADAWSARNPEASPAERRGWHEFCDAVKRGELIRLLSHPDGDAMKRRASGAAHAEVLTEFPFELLLDGRWVSGKMDRLVVYRDGAGALLAADVVDFKTSAIRSGADITAAVEEYRPQMQMYRRCVALLLALPPAAIRLTLAFTGPGLVVAVDG